MAKLSQQTVADTKKTEMENARRQAEHRAPTPQDSLHLNHQAETTAKPIDPFDHSVKDLESTVASGKK